MHQCNLNILEKQQLWTVTRCLWVCPTGTFISAFTVLCGAHSELISERGVCCVFWLNVAAALIQILTAVIMVGWIMSIFWGMDMVILASQWLSVCLFSLFFSLCNSSFFYLSHMCHAWGEHLTFDRARIEVKHLQCLTKICFSGVQIKHHYFSVVDI